MAITRLWFITLKPDHTTTDPTFLALWARILDLCACYTPAPVSSSSQIHLALAPRPARPHHFLLRSATDDSLLVLVSSYPSLALCMQADAAYSARFKKDVLKHVRHRALRQLDLEDAEVVPALIAPGRTSRRSSGQEGSEGDRDEEEDGVTVTISDRNPLKAEIEGMRSGLASGLQSPVLPPDREISGGDVFEIPPVPADGRPDAFEKQRQEGKRWIRIRRGLPKVDEGVVEVFRLKELLSR